MKLNLTHTRHLSSEHAIELDGSTHACATRVCGGGVGRNMAEALWRLRGGRTRLLTAIGDDSDGKYLSGIALGLILDGCIIPGYRTASYAAVLDSRGECKLGLGDMTIHSQMPTDMVDRYEKVLEQAPLVVLDGNVPQDIIDHVLRLCNQQNKPVFFEPTDKRKAVKALRSNHHVTFASPNLSELRAMASLLQPHNLPTGSEIRDILHLSEIVTGNINYLIVTLGPKGVLTVKKVPKDGNKMTARLYMVEALHTVKNVSGAGDCFASGFIHGFLLGLKESECVSIGFMSAKQALNSDSTVPYNLQVMAQAGCASFKKLNC